MSTVGTLVYDGDCGFCRACADWAAAHSGCEITPWQALDLDEVGLTETQVSAAAYWIEEGSAPRAGARAIAGALRSCRAPGLRLLGRLIDLGPVRPVAALGYVTVARNRSHLSRLMRSRLVTGLRRWRAKHRG